MSTHTLATARGTWHGSIEREVRHIPSCSHCDWQLIGITTEIEASRAIVAHLRKHDEEAKI